MGALSISHLGKQMIFSEIVIFVAILQQFVEVIKVTNKIFVQS